MGYCIHTRYNLSINLLIGVGLMRLPDHSISAVAIFDGLRRVSGLRREPVVSVKNPTLIPTSHWKRWSRLCRDSWQTLTLSLQVPCTEHPHRTRNERVGVCHDRVGIIFLSGGWGSVWGSSRRLLVPYVIPRPGVPRHFLTTGLRHVGCCAGFNQWSELCSGEVIFFLVSLK